MTGGRLLDTNVLISLAQGRYPPASVARLSPAATAISVVTEAELRSGLNAVSGRLRLDRAAFLEELLRRYDPLPIDSAVARAYGHVHLAMVEAGRQHRGRFADLLIAATAIAHDLTLVTDNVDDFAGLEAVVDLARVTSQSPVDVLRRPSARTHAIGILEASARTTAWSRCASRTAA